MQTAHDYEGSIEHFGDALNDLDGGFDQTAPVNLDVLGPEWDAKKATDALLLYIVCTATHRPDLTAKAQKALAWRIECKFSTWAEHYNRADRDAANRRRGDDLSWGAAA